MITFTINILTCLPIHPSHLRASMVYCLDRLMPPTLQVNTVFKLGLGPVTQSWQYPLHFNWTPYSTQLGTGLTLELTSAYPIHRLTALYALRFWTLHLTTLYALRFSTLHLTTLWGLHYWTLHLNTLLNTTLDYTRGTTLDYTMRTTLDYTICTTLLNTTLDYTICTTTIEHYTWLHYGGYTIEPNPWLHYKHYIIEHYTLLH